MPRFASGCRTERTGGGPRLAVDAVPYLPICFFSPGPPLCTGSTQVHGDALYRHVGVRPRTRAGNLARWLRDAVGRWVGTAGRRPTFRVTAWDVRDVLPNLSIGVGSASSAGQLQEDAWRSSTQEGGPGWTHRCQRSR